MDGKLCACCGSIGTWADGCCSVACRDLRDTEQERDEAVAALRELVRLKDLKDAVPQNPRSAMALDYEANKPKAWAEARRIVAQYT